MPSVLSTPNTDYYDIFYKYVMSLKTYKKEFAESLIEKLKDEEVLLRLSEETLRDEKLVIEELSKYLPTNLEDNSSLIPKSDDTSQFENIWIIISIGIVSIIIVAVIAAKFIICIRKKK